MSVDFTFAIQIKDVCHVYNGGRHNAFTDLCRSQVKLYLGFRS